MARDFPSATPSKTSPCSHKTPAKLQKMTVEPLHTATRNHFVALDGLRGAAAIAVAVGHANIVLGANRYFVNSALAVDFFFMLSGFVLAHAYGERLARAKSFLPYLTARIIRLSPLIVLGTIFGASAYLARGEDLTYIGRLFVQGSLLIPEVRLSRLDASIFPVNPPAWSLFFEMIGSALIGLGLWRGKRMLVVVSISASALLYVVAKAGTFDTGWSWNTLPAGLARVMFGMGAGVFLYTIHSKGLHRIPPLHIGIAAFILLAVLSSTFETVTFQLAAVMIIFPFLILGAARSGDHWPSVCKFSGDISYPLYIVHWPIYLWIDLLVPQLLKGIALLACSSLAAAMMSIISLRLYDQPVRGWLTVKARRFQAPSVENRARR